MNYEIWKKEENGNKEFLLISENNKNTNFYKDEVKNSTLIKRFFSTDENEVNKIYNNCLLNN